MEHKIKLTIDDLELEVVKSEDSCCSCYFYKNPCTICDCYELCSTLKYGSHDVIFKQINKNEI